VFAVLAAVVPEVAVVSEEIAQTAALSVVGQTAEAQPVAPVVRLAVEMSAVVVEIAQAAATGLVVPAAAVRIVELEPAAVILVAVPGHFDLYHNFRKKHCLRLIDYRIFDISYQNLLNHSPGTLNVI